MNSEKMMEGIGYIDEKLIAESRNEPSRKYFGVKKTVALIIAAVLCFSLAVTAGASAMNGPLYDILYAVFPSVAQSLKPVNVSCVDNGIRMEVVSASVEGSKAKIYISMQDIEGVRIDETIDLYDSYHIKQPFDSTGFCSKVSYDEKTKTATFLITITRTDGKDIKNGTVTFSVGEFMSKRGYFSGYIDEIDLSTADENAEIQNEVDKNGYAYDGKTETKEYLENMPCLVPQGNLYSPFPNVTITGIGFVDGKLHIQMLFENRSKTDSHGFVHLVDEDGNRIESPFAVYFLKDANTERHDSYYEEVFEISPEELENCRLFGEFWSSNTHVEGDWEVTFNLEDAE